MPRRILPLSVWCTKANIAFYEDGVPRRILPLSVWCTKANIAFKYIMYQGDYCL